MTLTQLEISNFWIRVYFGTTNSNELKLAAIDRAYRDFNRTMHGFARIRTNQGYNLLKNSVDEITSDAINNNFDQVGFDDWHRKMCDKLKSDFIRFLGYDITYGQAQKWINMSLKYMSAIGNHVIAGILNNYEFFHIPIDNIIQEKLVLHNISSIPIRWSRINDYDIYLNYQYEVRSTFTNQIPLDVEFRLFNS